MFSIQYQVNLDYVLFELILHFKMMHFSSLNSQSSYFEQRSSR